MPRKPIVPVFAGAAEPAPAIPLFAGAEKKKKKLPDDLPLSPARLGIGTEWHIVVAAVLLALILVAYGNSFQSEWVLDNKYIIELDPRTKAISWDDFNNKPGVREIFTQDYWWPKGISGLYRPITSFTYWLNWTVFGNGNNPSPREQVVGFHWINLAIHFLNAFLFYRLMLRLTRRFWVSFFAAAVFATHPIATESVTNIIGRADMFAATCVVGGMLLYIDAQRYEGWRRVLWLTALMALAVFGMFSKESSIAIGLVVAAYDLIYRVGERLRQYVVRELSLFLVRLACIAGLFFCAVRIYLLSIIPWMTPMPNNSAAFTFALLATLVGLVGLFFSMALLSLRKFWVYAPPLLASAILLFVLGTLKQPQWGYLIGMLVSVIVFVGVEYWFANYWPDEARDETAEERAISWRGFFDGYFVLLPALILMLGVRHWVFENTTPAEEPFLDNPLRGLGFIGSRMTAFKVWFLLLWKLIWPVHLSSDYSYNQIVMFGWHDATFATNMACVGAMLLFFAFLAIAVWCWCKGQKAIAFFMLLYFINYIPTGNFLYIIGSIMAERFMYLPLIGFAACVAIAVDLIARKLVGSPLDDESTAQAPAPSRWSQYRYVPHAVLAVLIVLYGIRAFYRNYAWHTDVTLWEAAKRESPISFRSYQSYAFALFEQDAAGNCDRMIATDEAGLKIVDNLPNPLNSSRLYLHLGMYYGLKGELLSKQVQGGMEVTDAAVPWFQKSAAILERGVPIDRAFNEVNRERDVKRGRNGTDTPDVGLAPVYGYLGVAYLRLNLLDQAERTFRYMRHLDCTDMDAYLKLASVQERERAYDKEVVSLMQVVLLDKDGTHPEVWPALNEAFQHINTEPYPCVLVKNGRPQLDLSRVAVRDAVLQAYRQFVIVFLQTKRTALAEGARDTAVKSYGFDRKALFDPLFDPDYLKQFPIPVPPDPVFWKPPKVQFEWMIDEVKHAVLEGTNGVKPEELQMKMRDGRAIYSTLDGKVTVSEEGQLLSR